MHISFHEQVFGRVTKWKMASLTSLDNIAIWLYHSMAGFETISLVERTEAKRGQNGFLYCHVTPQVAPTDMTIL